MSNRATDASLDALHALLADAQAEELRRSLDRARKPKTLRDEDGKLIPNPEFEPLSPKLLGVIRAFLKDNGIDAPAASPRFNDLVDQLRDLPIDEMASA